MVEGNPYFDAKKGQEEMARDSGVPYTIAKSTQFYEFFNTIASGFTQDGFAKLPDALFQPLAADDLASALVAIALQEPKNFAVSIAGSKCASFETRFQRFFKITQDNRIASTDKSATYYGGKLSRDWIAPGVPDYMGKNRLKIGWQAQMV